MDCPCDDRALLFGLLHKPGRDVLALYDSVLHPGGGRSGAGRSLQFLFYGGIVVLPVVLVYTVGVYWVFRGRIRKS
jgi:hypothetical protein